MNPSASPRRLRRLHHAILVLAGLLGSHDVVADETSASPLETIVSSGNRLLQPVLGTSQSILTTSNAIRVPTLTASNAIRTPQLAVSGLEARIVAPILTSGNAIARPSLGGLDLQLERTTTFTTTAPVVIGLPTTGSGMGNLDQGVPIVLILVLPILALVAL